ncbi:hypothetical protein RGQ15_13045 [Paracoccus sp. MBLB3053]|uniref:Zinc transport system substrate-binding protein n=1 Tax=Paracoccus aurantius TaxID=3073814 RepID=A0ABU2HTX0_9RHOB|nr:hypothetical protein [Paracoccus sp. MBLB3053]MDS9468494.1 hypothetical protein [Paracoccus sp. MBLB3053]
MFRQFAASGVMALLLSGAAYAESHDHDHEGGDVTIYRVFVGDHDKGQVTAFDLDEPEHRWTFQTKGQVKIYSVADGGAVAAVQSDDDTVTFIASGVSLHAHGDHSDIETADPTAIAETLTGPRPFHLVEHGGKVAINFDKGGYAQIIDAHELSEGALKLARLPQARAHHGFAARLGENWVSTVASDQPVPEGESVPRLGLQAFDAEGQPLGDLATCTAIHGEAFSGVYLAAGCKEGVLIATAGSGGVVFEMLEYPADLPKGETTGTLLGSRGIQVFLGNYGAKGLVVVDPVDEPHFTYVELPFRRVDFALDPVRPSDAFVLTEDGQLHRINILEARIEASAKVTEPYSMDGHWNDPRPRIAMAGAEVVVTDPNAGLLRRISTADLTETGTIEIGGKPYNLAVVGGSGVAH